MNDDPYVYPGTSVLKNKFGIKDAAQLEVAERVITRARMREPMQVPPAMTPSGYQTIHRHIFRDVYLWAGELRTVNLEKIVTSQKTVAFEPGLLVPVNMKRIFGELKVDGYLRDLDKDIFAFRAAVYLEDLNRTHPFREGNGRVGRVFLELLAAQAGHALDRSRIDPQKWMEGSVQSFGQGPQVNHDIMTGVIREAMNADRDGERAGDSQEFAPKPPPRGRRR